MRLFPVFENPDFLSVYWRLMYSKLCEKRQQFSLDTVELNAAQLYVNESTYIFYLAQALAQQNYSPKATQVRDIYLDKWRVIHRLSLTDHLLHTIWVDILNTCLESFLSPQCYSYQKGKNFFDAARNCATYIRSQKKQSKIDLYVLRSDIRQYTDSIPLHDASPLWKSLRYLLEKNFGKNIPAYYWKLLVDLLRPEIILEDGSLIKNRVGLSLGTPLCSPLANLYLHSLDEYLTSIPGAYYCRYSDDFVFIHPDPNIFLEADKKISAILDGLALQRNIKKEKYIYLTLAGRAPETPALQEKFYGTHQFQFLGFHVKAAGTLAPSHEISRTLIRQFRKIIFTGARCLKGLSCTEKAYQLCQMLNHQFERAVTDGTITNWLILRYSTDRVFLKQLDTELALAVAEAVTQIRGVAAFEKISYHHIRHRFGLKSLCQLKNKGQYVWRKHLKHG